MLCRHCGKEIEQGRRFCVFCGTEQGPEAAAGAGGGETQQAQASQPGPGPGSQRRMSTAMKVIIGVVAVLIVAGAGIGIYFGVRNTSSEETATSQPTTIKPPKIVVPPIESEKLAYINEGDIYTIGLNGADRQKVTSRGDIVDFAVSPDGSWIAFVAAPGEQRVIFKMKPDGSDLSQVTLPEKGLADNPAFDPTSKYLYFTRVTPEDQADIEAARPYGVGFERYNIAANSVDHIYTYDGLQEQSIQGLYADPAGGDLFFNLYGSDYPSSRPHKLTLGPPVSDSVYLPILTDTGRYSVVAFELTGFSRDGAYVTYFKQILFASQESQTTTGQEVDACFRSTTSGDETSVATYVPSDSQQGEVSGMEFSRVADSTYYLSKVATGLDATSLTLDFYKGTTSGSPALTGLRVAITVDAQQYTPLVWRLLPVK